MEHSRAIMEDAGNAIEGAATSATSRPEANPTRITGSEAQDDDRKRKRDFSNEDWGSENNHDRQKRGRDTSNEGRGRQNNYDRRKPNRDFPNASMHHGSRGGRGGRGRGGRDGDSKRHTKGDMGRSAYFRSEPDKRQKTEDARQKRLAGTAPQMGVNFTQEEIDAEEKRPKRKVAVLIGYSGTGYKGMQISATEKTIEGDLFRAFVDAGAISKANADDPKKASLVRCARTDKGVHAAGNMISLKLIVEDDDIVQKINDNLSSQIRVWGIERTIGSFSSYQACDSRWYEYLIPSHALLPPHPSSWLAKKLEEFAEDQSGSREGYDGRQSEVNGFWSKVDEDIKPILEKIDEDIRFDVIKALNGEDDASAKIGKPAADAEQPVKAGKSVGDATDEPEAGKEKTEEAVIIINDPALLEQQTTNTDDVSKGQEEPSITQETTMIQDTEEKDRQLRLRAATKELRSAYSSAKRRYRIPKERVARIQAALSKFVGTSNYHNFTILKTFKDPSAKRHIKSFVVNPTPILIGDGPDEQKTEWLSLKVHGQSFMMHQIRKMVGMVALLVRCGSDINTLSDSLRQDRYSIPKVPGLGLLLERPVFDSYNKIQAPKHSRPTLEFSKFEKEMEEFKQREIYERIFREEEKNDEFGRFFNHIDNFKEPHFLYVTSQGLAATKGAEKKGEFEESDGEQVEGGEG